jgi:hypothetical protein
MTTLRQMIDYRWQMTDNKVNSDSKSSGNSRVRKGRSYHLSSIICHLIVLLLCSSTMQAQRLTAEIDREKIVIGQQAILQVKLEDFNPRIYSIAEWFVVPDTLDHLECTRIEGMDTIMVGGYATYVQKYIVTSFDSGSWKIPELKLSIRSKDDLKPVILKTKPVFLEVAPANVADLKEYHPLKEIQEVQVSNDLWLIIALGVIAVVSGFILRWFIRIRKRVRKKAAITNLRKKGRTPLYRALQQLAALKKEVPVLQPLQLKEYYTQIDDACRVYLSEMYLIQTLQKTSDEIMVMLKKYSPSDAARKELGMILSLCDSVKFAKYQPISVEEQVKAVDKAAACLQQLNKTYRKKKNAN